jgi:hypothetical protein
MPIVVYTYLYDAMVAWYMAQRYSAGPYVRWYAVTTLTSMGFLNIGSVVAVSAHYKAVWAMHLMETRDPLLFALVGVGLLTANILFSKWRRARALQSSSAPPSRWIALGYIVVSVVIFMYTSSLLPVTHA